MTVDQLRARVSAAISHKNFRGLAKLIPAESRDDPKALLRWFQWAASEDRRVAASPEFADAHSALSDLIAAHNSFVDRLLEEE